MEICGGAAESITKEAAQMAISALEKQVGKKTITERRDYVVFDDEYCINCYCPVCNRRIVSKDSTGFFAGHTAEYCEKCGQKIDWSEVDDEK